MSFSEEFPDKTKNIHHPICPASHRAPKEMAP